VGTAFYFATVAVRLLDLWFFIAHLEKDLLSFATAVIGYSHCLGEFGVVVIFIGISLVYKCLVTVSLRLKCLLSFVELFEWVLSSLVLENSRFASSENFKSLKNLWKVMTVFVILIFIDWSLEYFLTALILSKWDFNFVH